MTERRSTRQPRHPQPRQGIREACLLGAVQRGQAFGLYEALDGASLFKPPFRLNRSIEPVTTLLNRPRANIEKGVDLLWRWGHADYKEWLCPPPVPEKTPLTSA